MKPSMETVHFESDMGSAGSIAQVAEEETAKPQDASDLHNLEEARAELKRLRQLARDYVREREEAVLAASPRNRVPAPTPAGLPSVKDVQRLEASDPVISESSYGPAAATTITSAS
jgi:hypothetical protein